jgi:hypothetical protein
MMQLTLTFRDCGFAGRETASLGNWVVGTVEPAPYKGMRAFWTFYPEVRGRKINLSATSIEQARVSVEIETCRMLRDMGVPLPGDWIKVVVAGRETARPFSRSMHRGARS